MPIYPNPGPRGLATAARSELGEQAAPRACTLVRHNCARHKASGSTHAEGSRERRQAPLVDGLAGFEPVDRARHDAGLRSQFVDAIAASCAKTKGARRQGLHRRSSSLAVPSLGAGQNVKTCYSSLRLHAPEVGFDRIAVRRAQADAREAHVRGLLLIGSHEVKTFG